MRTLAILQLCAQSALAQGPQAASLSYERGPGSESCPTAGQVRDAVATRLGRDPFLPEAPRSVHVSVSREPKGLTATLRLVDALGQVQGTRQIRSDGTDCTDLANALELAIALAIDPLAGTRPAPPPPPPPPPTPPTVAAAPPPPAPLKRARWDFDLGGGIDAAVGLAPEVLPVLVVQGRARRASLSLGLEGRASFANSVPAGGGGTVSTSLLAGALLPCVRFSPLSACLVVAAGAERFAGHNLDQSALVTAPFAALGARAGIAFPVTRSLAIEVAVELEAPLLRDNVVVGTTPLWSTPTLAFEGGARLLWALPEKE